MYKTIFKNNLIIFKQLNRVELNLLLFGQTVWHLSCKSGIKQKNIIVVYFAFTNLYIYIFILNWVWMGGFRFWWVWYSYVPTCLCALINFVLKLSLKNCNIPLQDRFSLSISNESCYLIIPFLIIWNKL